MKNTINTFTKLVLLLTSIFFASCQDVIQVDLEDKSGQLVVDGFISDAKDEGRCKIMLTRTAYYFDTNPPKTVSGAVVTLKDNTGKTEILKENAAGTYTSDLIRGKVGNSYFLEIKTDGETYTSETKVLPVPRIDSIRYETKVVDNKEEVTLYYYGNELPEEGNYYRIKMYEDDKLLNKPLTILAFNDQFSNGRYYDGVKLNQGTPLKPNSSVRIELLSITQDSFLFYDDLFKQAADFLIFAPPRANVRTNIINSNPNSTKKAVGIFVGAGFTTKSGQLVGKKGMIR